MRRAALAPTSCAISRSAKTTRRSSAIAALVADGRRRRARRCCRRSPTARCRPPASRCCRSRTATAIDLATGATVTPRARDRATTSCSTTACAASSRRAIAALQAHVARPRDVRLAAAKELQSGADEAMLPAIERGAREGDRTPEIKSLLTLTQATHRSSTSSDKAAAHRRDSRARARAAIRTPRCCCCRSLEKKGGRFAEPDADVRAEARSRRCSAIESRLATGETRRPALQRHQPRQRSCCWRRSASRSPTA